MILVNSIILNQKINKNAIRNIYIYTQSKILPRVEKISRSPQLKSKRVYLLVIKYIKTKLIETSLSTFFLLGDTLL